MCSGTWEQLFLKSVTNYQSINQSILKITAAGLYKRIYYFTMPRHKVHGHVSNENGIACVIHSANTGFDNGFLMNCA